LEVRLQGQSYAPPSILLFHYEKRLIDMSIVLTEKFDCFTI
jgi:hypothetical protein